MLDNKIQKVSALNFSVIQLQMPMEIGYSVVIKKKIVIMLRANSKTAKSCDSVRSLPYYSFQSDTM